MTYLSTLVIAVGVTLPTLALAQQGSVRAACANDIKTLCGSVDSGRGAIRECMREHRAQLSADCKSAIDARALRRQERGGNQTKPNGATDQD